MFLIELESFSREQIRMNTKKEKSNFLFSNPIVLFRVFSCLFVADLFLN